MYCSWIHWWDLRSKTWSCKRMIATILLSFLLVAARNQYLLSDRLASELSTSAKAQSLLAWSTKETKEPIVPLKHRQDYNFTVAICAIVKDAEAHLEEWIDYHLLGVDFQNIYLYDNSDNFDLEQWYHRTRQHPVYSRVEVRHWPGREVEVRDGTEYAQNAMNTDCIHRYGLNPNGPQHDYFGLLDDDEFTVIQSNAYSDIRGVLQDYLVPYGGSLTMNWMLFGMSNHSIYAPIPVTRRFQYRDRLAHPVTKSFVKASDFGEMWNPHAFSLLNGAIRRTTKYPGAPLTETTPAKASDLERPSDIVLLYHYRYTSEKEYIVKRCVRGNASGKNWCNSSGEKLRTDNVPSHITPRNGEIYDDMAWKVLTAHVPRYRVFDEWPDFS